MVNRMSGSVLGQTRIDTEQKARLSLKAGFLLFIRLSHFPRHKNWFDGDIIGIFKTVIGINSSLWISFAVPLAALAIRGSCAPSVLVVEPLYFLRPVS